MLALLHDRNRARPRRAGNCSKRYIARQCVRKRMLEIAARGIRQ